MFKIKLAIGYAVVACMFLLFGEFIYDTQINPATAASQPCEN